MFSEIFIKRPVLSIVISLIIFILGTLAIVVLPVAQYPDIAPPTVKVRGNYGGANATVVEDAVATPVESRINGIPGAMYMESTSTNDGTYNLSVVFELGTDVDKAANEVQNRLAQAQAFLPESIKRTGISASKESSSILQIITLYSPNGTHSSSFIDNYGAMYVKNELMRVKGVGNVLNFGKDFSVRIWLDPQKMSNLGLIASDVVRAVREQNNQVAAGAIGSAPTPEKTTFQYTIRVKGRLPDAKAFESIVVGSNPQTGALVYLRDVAQTELGSVSYEGNPLVNGKKGVGLAVFQSPGGNALEIAKSIDAKMKELEKQFPEDLAWALASDSTQFVRVAISGVIKTFIEALILVLLVVFIFLQSWRATLIPMLAVPVSIVGTFAAFTLLGFTINIFTLLALVLSIGIVVDDAIVVVEAAQHHIDHNKLSAREATLKAMQEVGGPVIAIALILCAVFVPVAFMPGITGRLYQQFAVTISISVLISAWVALTLTPALCATMLRSNPVNEGAKGLYRWFYKFNQAFDRFTRNYGKIVQKTIKMTPLMIVFLVLIYVFSGLLARFWPTTLVPDEDQGLIYLSVQLPEASSINRTDAAMEKVISILNERKDVIENFFTVPGFNFLTNSASSYSGAGFILLKHWDERKGKKASDILRDLQDRLSNIKEANVLALLPPAIDGLGNFGGISLNLKQASGSIDDLAKVQEELMGRIYGQPDTFMVAFSTFVNHNPEIELTIDKEKVRRLGVSLQDVQENLNILLGGIYINDVTLFNRPFRVYAQAQANFRDQLDKLMQYYVRNDKGYMVSIGSLVHTRRVAGAPVINHFNLDRSTSITIVPNFPKGVSSGVAIKELEKILKDLPEGYSYEFSGLTRQEIEAGNAAGFIFALSILFVFLFLAALYESWSVPFAVLLSVPIGILGAYLAFLIKTLLSSMELSTVYAQIGLITLIGLSAKNAILIVEYCKINYERGVPIVQAAKEAAMLRLRPILMTSFAFILGILPLIFSSGAGAGARVNIGVTVFGGMLLATTLGIFFIPMLYVLVIRISEGRKRVKEADRPF